MNIFSIKQWLKKKSEESKEESDYYTAIYFMLSELETFRGELPEPEEKAFDKPEAICKNCEHSSKSNSFCCIDRSKLLPISSSINGKPPEGCPFALEHIMMHEQRKADK